jgi:hypothetical protein
MLTQKQNVWIFFQRAVEGSARNYFNETAKIY